MLEYLEVKRVEDLMKNHSEFIGFPVRLYTKTNTEKEITDNGNYNDMEDKDDNKPKVDEVDKDGAKKRKKRKR